MYFFNIYFLIGIFSALAFAGFWWLYKDSVERPASPSLMLLRAGTYILVWPVRCTGSGLKVKTKHALSPYLNL